MISCIILYKFAFVKYFQKISFAFLIRVLSGSYHIITEEKYAEWMLNFSATPEDCVTSETVQK